MSSLADRQKLHALARADRNCQPYNDGGNEPCTSEAVYSIRMTVHDAGYTPCTMYPRFCYGCWNAFLLDLVWHGIREGNRVMRVYGDRIVTYHMNTIRDLEDTSNVS